MQTSRISPTSPPGSTPANHPPSWASEVKSSYLHAHFILSYYLVFLAPIIDVIVFLPTHLIMPRWEFALSIPVALVHSLLVWVSCADIYTHPTYLEPCNLFLCASARMMSGVAASEVLCLISQAVYMHFTWPYAYKQIGFLLVLLFGHGQVTQAMGFEQPQQLANEHGPWQSFYTDRFDFDGLALLVSCTLRLMVLAVKCLLAMHIRYETHRRNQKLVKQSSPHKRVPECGQILFTINLL